MHFWSMRLYAFFPFVLLLSWGCAAPQAAPTTPGKEESRTSGAFGPDDAEITGPQADVLYALAEAVPQAPAQCPMGNALPPQIPCKDARKALADALLDHEHSDEMLRQLEACSEFSVGLVRALRAELGSPECADLLVESVVGEKAPAVKMSGDTRETLVALGLGARLRRLATDAPTPPDEHTKEALGQYFRVELFPWIKEQATAIYEMAAQGRELSGYARGIVAIEAGNADMRFVEIARSVPVSDEIAEFEEAKDLYYASLDEQLEPRKARGRDAALVGLREMALLGVRDSSRVQDARELLSRVYGGHRINALDTLLVPVVPALEAKNAEEAIANSVPTPYATSFIGKAPVSAALVRAHLKQGMPPGLRRAVEAEGDAEAKFWLARALFESGRIYFRAEDFGAAQVLFQTLLDAKEEKLSEQQRADARLLHALSVALVAGPGDAAEMIARGPRFADSLGNLVPLDGLATEPGTLGGRAEFDAAYLRELVAPEGAPDYWKDLAARYSKSAQRLPVDEASFARDRAQACLAIEKTVREQLRTAPKQASTP